MNIAFASSKLRKMCNSQKERRKSRGVREGDLLGRHLDNLRAAATMEDLRDLPGRCHPLKADRKGQYALDLAHPNRLVFSPDHAPLPELDSGGLDRSKVTAVVILGIVDYH